MSLCRTADGSGLIVVKLNHKAEYYSHVLFEPARAIFFGSFVRFFKQYNHLYSDIEIDLDNTSELLTNFELSTRNLHEEMKISEPLEIIPEQKYSSDVTNISKLPEAYLSILETLKKMNWK